MNIKTLILSIFAFLLVYTGVNSYVILRIGGLLDVKKGILYLLIVLVSLSLPLAMYFERTFPNPISRIVYTISSLWIGVIFFSLCFLLAYELIQPFYKIPYAGIIIVSLIGILSILSVINAIGVRVKEVEVPINNLEKNFTIVHLSDLHLGTIRNSNFLKKVVEKTNKINPDIVLITGDMIDGVARLHKGMLDKFDKLNAPVYFVTGNHEAMEDLEKVYALLNETKINALKNEIIIFEGIQIVGIEYGETKDHLGKEFKKLNVNSSMPSILLYHSPQIIEETKKAKIDLQLAGHTHNGQIFPFNLLVKIFFKHIKGLYELEERFLYVSPGTGTWGPYMRLGSRNEITKINIVGSSH